MIAIAANQNWFKIMSEEYTEVDCCFCGIEFKIPSRVINKWKNNQKPFYCPNGHTLAYSKESQASQINKLNDEIKELNSKLADATNKIQELTNELEIWKPRT